MENKIEIYESLLNEVSSLEKECFHLEIEFTREFGDEINNIFALKIECIVLKKKIAFCIKKVNHNEEINFDEMEKNINKLVEGKRKELEEMIAYKKAVDSEKGKRVSYDDKKEIRSIYYQIVHLIHPDLHKELQDNEKIKELWQISVDSYKRNDLKTLKRALDQILLIVDVNQEIVLENIDEKIYVIEKEIKDIKDNNPYKYKFILEDDEEKENLHKKYHEDEQYYLDYSKKLFNELLKFNIKKERKYDA